MSTSLLAQVRNVARKAAKAGRGWKIAKGGSIQCADKRCTLGAILFQHYEPVRKLQEEFEALIARAKKVGKGTMVPQFSVNDSLFDEYSPINDKFPDPTEVAEVLDMDDKLTALVVRANDFSRNSLEATVKAERELAEELKELGDITSINEHEEYINVVRALKARIILEEELIGKGK